MSDSRPITWPRVAERDHQIACHFCDTLHEVTLIEEGKAAHCVECGHVLYRNRPNSVPRAVAFGVTAVCLAVLVFIFPFINMDAQGNKSEVTVPGAVLGLWESGGPAIAVSVALFVIVLPLAMLLMLLYLCVPLLHDRAWVGALPMMRWLQLLQPWVMVEVFFLGVIVSLLKLVKVADITLGIGFWSVAGLMICLAGAVGGIDRLELWDRLEHATVKRERRSS